MNSSWPLLAVLAFIYGLMVVSRVGHWLILIAGVFLPSVLDGRVDPRRWSAAPTVLNSGPLALAIAVGAVTFAAKSSRADFLSVTGGLGAAVGVGAVSSLLLLWRRRRPVSHRVP